MIVPFDEKKEAPEEGPKGVEPEVWVESTLVCLEPVYGIGLGISHRSEEPFLLPSDVWEGMELSFFTGLLITLPFCELRLGKVIYPETGDHLQL